MYTKRQEARYEVNAVQRGRRRWPHRVRGMIRIHAGLIAHGQKNKLEKLADIRYVFCNNLRARATQEIQCRDHAPHKLVLCIGVLAQRLMGLNKN